MKGQRVVHDAFEESGCEWAKNASNVVVHQATSAGRRHIFSVMYAYLSHLELVARTKSLFEANVELNLAC